MEICLEINGNKVVCYIYNIILIKFYVILI